jgi:hypothetical protein
MNRFLTSTTVDGRESSHARLQFTADEPSAATTNAAASIPDGPGRAAAIKAECAC